MALALDGSAHANAASASSVGASITTSASDCIILAMIVCNGGPVVSVVGGGLTWGLHAESSGASRIELWSALAASPLSAQTITVTQSSAAYITIDIFGVSGADTSNIFDDDASVPNVVASGNNTLSTAMADTMIIHGCRMVSIASPTEQSGFVKISGADFTLSQYKIVSAAQSSLSIGAASGSMNGGIATAIRMGSGGGSSGNPHYYYQQQAAAA